jgi:hypothetical protein
MIIPKQIQFIVKMLVALSCGILLGVLLHGRVGAWAVLAGFALFLIVRLVMEIVLSVADECVRRVSRDPLWVQEHENIDE